MYKRTKAVLAFADKLRPGLRANMLAGFFDTLLWLAGPRKSVARRNIAFCFPEKSTEEREKILREAYSNMVWTGVELHAWHHDPTLIDRMGGEQQGLENIDKVLSEGRGAVAISGHISNWELAAAWMSRHYPFSGIVRHSDSPWQKELIETLRERGGLRTISNKSSLKKIITLLRHNEIFGALADQHGGREGLIVPFFGTETSTPQGPGAFSVLTGAPMIPVYFTRLAPFRYRATAGTPIRPPQAMERDEAIKYMTLRMNEEYEKMIRSEPGQWLWAHRRFREIITD